MIFFIRSPCSFIRLISGDIECHVGERPSADISVVAIVRVIFREAHFSYLLFYCHVPHRLQNGPWEEIVVTRTSF